MNTKTRRTPRKHKAERNRGRLDRQNQEAAHARIAAPVRLSRPFCGSLRESFVSFASLCLFRISRFGIGARDQAGGSFRDRKHCGADRVAGSGSRTTAVPMAKNSMMWLSQA